MLYFLFVVLSPNAICICSEAAASMNSISQKASPSKRLRWSSFLKGSGSVVMPSLKNAFYKKYALSQPFDFVNLLGFWEQKY